MILASLRRTIGALQSALAAIGCSSARASRLLPLCVLLLVIGIGRGGDRNFPGGNTTGPKLKMDVVSIANRMKRKESKKRTVLRKAAAAAAAVEKETAEQQRELLREKLAEQPMCVRRKLGSQRRQWPQRQQQLRRQQLLNPRRSRWSASFRSRRRQRRDVRTETCAVDSDRVCWTVRVRLRVMCLKEFD
ncbi:hypothetical protein OAO87_03005 [bacterium]|nr:hypothetical protein [bacterium]